MSELNLPGLTTLRRVELETLYRVGEILSRSLDFRHTSREILRALDEQAGMSRSMVSVLDPESGDLVVHAVNGNEDEGHESVRYQAGEGLLGLILEEKSTLALPRLGDEPRFLNRLGVFDRRLAFIAAPISLSGLKPPMPGPWPARGSTTTKGRLAGSTGVPAPGTMRASP